MHALRCGCVRQAQHLQEHSSALADSCWRHILVPGVRWFPFLVELRSSQWLCVAVTATASCGAGWYLGGRAHLFDKKVLASQGRVQPVAPTTDTLCKGQATPWHREGQHTVRTGAGFPGLSHLFRQILAGYEKTTKTPHLIKYALYQ